MACNFEVNQTKIKGGCQSGRKVVPNDSKSDFPLALAILLEHMQKKFEINQTKIKGSCK